MTDDRYATILKLFDEWSAKAPNTDRALILAAQQLDTITLVSKSLANAARQALAVGELTAPVRHQLAAALFQFEEQTK